MIDQKKKETNTRMSRSGVTLGFRTDRAYNKKSSSIDYLMNLLLRIKEVYLETNTGFLYTRVE